MPDYRINWVDDNPPKQWVGPKGTVFYINVMIDDHAKPVSVGKRTSNALKVGDVISGDIVPTDYDTDKFKAAPPAGGFGGSRVDPAEERAKWAIGLAYVGVGKVEDVEIAARDLYAMVDRVKSPQTQLPIQNTPATQPLTGYDKAKAQAARIRESLPSEEPLPDPPDGVPFN